MVGMREQRGINNREINCRRVGKLTFTISCELYKLLCHVYNDCIILLLHNLSL